VRLFLERWVVMFGDRLKNLRKELNLSQEELGKKFNVNKGSVSNWENDNRNPDFNTLNKIADYFNVSIDYLLGRTDIKGEIPMTNDNKLYELVEKIYIDMQSMKKELNEFREETNNRFDTLETKVDKIESKLDDIEANNANRHLDINEQLTKFSTDLEFLSHKEFQNEKEVYQIKKKLEIIK